MADTLHPAPFRAEVKRAAGAHEHPAHVAASFGASGHRGSHEIPGMEALDLLRPLGLGAREADVIDVALLLLPCPVAVISRGTMPPSVSTAGVLLPTQAASIQCSFAKLLSVRLNFVAEAPRPTFQVIAALRGVGAIGWGV